LKNLVLSFSWVRSKRLNFSFLKHLNWEFPEFYDWIHEKIPNQVRNDNSFCHSRGGGNPFTKKFQLKSDFLNSKCFSEQISACAEMTI
jgi:hypothetical protein